MKMPFLLSLVLVGVLATVASSLYKVHEAVMDASFDNYGFPFPWLVYSEGFGAVIPTRWTLNWVFLVFDVLFYTAIGYALVLIYKTRPFGKRK